MMKKPAYSIDVPVSSKIEATGAVGCGATRIRAMPARYPIADSTCSARMPTASTSAPLMKIATVNAQKAGLKISPICSLVSRNAALMAGATSPRMAKTIDVVTSDTQLATNSFCLSISVQREGVEAVADRDEHVLPSIDEIRLRCVRRIADP